jgi:Zn-dependent protease with chaperone function
VATPYAGRPDPSRLEPLWDRVDRNRLRLLAYLVVFAGTFAALVALAVAALGGLTLLLFDEGGDRSALQMVGRWVFADGPWRPVAVGLLLAVAYEAWALLRSERWLLKRLKATLVPRGELLDSKLVLKDMAIAAGFDVAPSLHLLDTPNVNAFVFRARDRRPVVGVTRGLVTRLTVDERRAVFANLTARLVSGDSAVSSAVASLLAPLQWFRAHRLRAIDEEDAMMRRALEERRADPWSRREQAFPISGLFLPVLFPLILAGEILAAAQRRSHLVASEKADAEGMLLLKDPRNMLSALERSIRLNNNVVEADHSLGDLFYCWTGDSTDDESDPEWHRVARLREVLGVEGHIPHDPSPALVSESFPPPAPRLSDHDGGRR